MKKLGQKGMSMINVLISAGMLAGLALVGTRIAQNQSKSNKTQILRQEAYLKMSGIIQELQNSLACANTFAGLIDVHPQNQQTQNTIYEIKDHAGAVVYPPPNGNPRVKFDSAKIISVGQPGPEPISNQPVGNLQAEVLLKINLNPQGGSTTGSSFYTMPFNMKVDLDANGLIESCDVASINVVNPNNPAGNVNSNDGLDDEELCELKRGVWHNEICHTKIIKHYSHMDDHNSNPSPAYWAKIEEFSNDDSFSFDALTLPDGVAYHINVNYFVKFLFEHSGSCPQPDDQFSNMTFSAQVNCGSPSCSVSIDNGLQLQKQSLESQTSSCYMNPNCLTVHSDNFTDTNGYLGISSTPSNSSSPREVVVSINRAINNLCPGTNLTMYIMQYAVSYEATPYSTP